MTNDTGTIPASSSRAVGQPLSRAEGRLKVTGQAEYTAEADLPGMTYAVLVPSEIARGRVLSVDTKDAEAAPGILAVLTHLTVPHLTEAPVLLTQSGQSSPKGSAGQQFLPMQGDVIHYAGQPIALVVAETLEQATGAAALVTARYARETHRVDFEAARTRTFRPVDGWPEPSETARGDVAAGLGAADVRVTQVYHTALQHHVTMEPHATVAHWDGDALTLHEPSTWVQGVTKTVATWLGIPPEKVRVVQKFVGGSFGSKGPTWPHVALAAVAAQRVARPVKLVLSRQQTFWSNGYRPRIRHFVQLGAKSDGTLTALQHEATAHTAPFDGRIVAPVTKTSPRMYACPNVATAYRLARLNLSGPFTMRGPGETPGLFAVESAMDELAYALDMDPIALRLKNYADQDPQSGKPWSSKSLRACYEQGAARFGWGRRTPTPGSMKSGDERPMGWGMATMMYDAKSAPTAASARMETDGSVVLRSATCDPGTGVYTIMPQIAADALGVPVGRVRLELGDSRLPTAPIAAGSQTSASVGSAVRAAAESLRRALLAAAFSDPASPLYGLAEAQVCTEEGRVFIKADPRRGQTYADILRRCAPDGMEATEEVNPHGGAEDFSLYSFGAHFAEVQVDPDLGEIRVSRYVGAFGAGRILNAKTARSQLLGGVIWGLGMALHEETHLDKKTGRIVNPDLSEYLIPVNADVPDLDVFFVEEEDAHVNPLGVKGIGEIGTIGAAAAVANAVYHATGRRVRDLPITLEKVMSEGSGQER